MTKAGRELERVVAAIERTFSDTAMTVTSPEFVLGRNSRTRREVDVSLRGQLGSASIFVMVECRDRSRPATVQWIDEVAAKANDVGASKAVVVSAAGFANTAREYAKQLGIDTRTLSELESEDSLAWLAHVPVITTQYNCVEFVSVAVELETGAESPEPIPGEAPQVGALTALFRRKRDGAPAGLMDAWNDVCEKVYDPKLPERRRLPIEIRYTNPDDRFQLQIRGQWWDVESLKLVVEVWIDVVEQALSQFRYSTDGTSIAEGFSFEVDHGAGPRKVVLTLTHDEELMGSQIPAGAVITVAMEPADRAEPTQPINFGG
ncbi:MAG: restriction endonuclease [Acidimicrobiia bacterium]